MLYQKLTRANELDVKISDLHRLLADLYAERANLLGPNKTAAPGPSSSPKALALTAQVTHKALAASWQPYGVKLPSYQTLSKKLDKATALAARLKQDSPSLSGKIAIVAVPPFKILQDLLEQPDDGRRPVFTFTDADSLKKTKKSQVWSLLLIIDGEFSQPVRGIRAFVDNGDFRYNKYDCGALGIQELIAAELQGIKIAGDNGWVLLLKDSTSGDYVPCVTRQDESIVFDIDDANGLLGNNSVRPAIRAA